MNKKEYQSPAIAEVKLQHRLMDSITSGGQEGGGTDSRRFNGGVVDDDEEESTL